MAEDRVSRTVSIVSARTVGGDELEITGYEEAIMQVLNEEMEKIATQAREYAPVSKTPMAGGGHEEGGGLKSSIHAIPAHQETEDFITAGVGSSSRHAPPVEYGSGIFNTHKWRSGAQKYTNARPYTAGRPNLRVVPDGEFRIYKASARALALPMPFKTPPSGRITPEEIYRRSHDKHGRPYYSFKTGQPIIFSMWADNPGQEAQPFIRRAFRNRYGAINSRLRSVVARNTHMKYKDVRVTIEVGFR